MEKKALFKVSCLSKDECDNGAASFYLVHPKCDIYVSIQCFNTTPYSVYLWSKQSSNDRIDFPPSDLYAVIQSIKHSQNFDYRDQIDVSV